MNALDARDETVKADKQEKWVTMDANIRNTVKGCVWNQLGSPVQEIRHTCAQVIAKIAGAEMPKALWPSLVTDLQNNMATGDPGKRQSTLEALGYICEEIEHEHLQEADVNAMLTAIVQGMRKEEESNEIRLAATNALVNAMYFAEGNFEREQERNYIMQVTCEATVCADVRVRQAAFEVLVGAAENYYEKLQPYMTAIFDLTVKATKGDEETFSYLYLGNVVGAMAGALVTAMVLIETFGFRSTLLVAAGVNVVIGVVAILMPRLVRAGTPQSIARTGACDHVCARARRGRGGRARATTRLFGKAS